MLDQGQIGRLLGALFAVLIVSSMFIGTNLGGNIVAAASPVFQDGFESGSLSSWSGGGSAVMVQSPVHSGSYAARATGPNSYWYKNLGSGYSNLFFAGYVRMQSALSNDQTTMFAYILDSSYAYIVSGGLRLDSGGTARWGLRVNANWYPSSGSVNVITGQWYFVEIQYSTSGTANLWVDGNLVASATGQALYGNAQIIQGGNPTSVTPTGFVSYGDDYIVDTNYISPSSPTPTPTPSPTTLTKVAVSSATASSYDGSHTPSLAINGVESNGNYWGTNSGLGLPQWLQLDLGAQTSISQVITHFYDQDSRTYTYYVQVSSDGSSWSTVVSTKTGRGTVTDTFNLVAARYVRISVTGNTANLAAHIEEIKVYQSTGTPTSTGGSVVISSATASSYDGSHTPSLAINGVESNGNYWGTNSGLGLPQWLQLDLGAQTSISQVITHFYDQDSRTYTYYVQVSSDGSSWSTVVSTKTGRGTVTDTFNLVAARYVRISVTGNTANLAAHIEEIKVYQSTGTPTSTPTPTATPTVSPAPTPTPAPVPGLHTSGVNIYDSNNNQVILNGVTTPTLFGYESGASGGVLPESISPADINTIANHGLNFVRIDLNLNTALYGQDYHSQTPTKLNYYPRFWTLLDSIVTQAAAKGMWVMLIFDTTTISGIGGYWGTTNGFPTWMYDGSWSYFNKIYPNNGAGYTSAQRDFWNTNDPTAANVRAAYQTWWKDVAYHYRNTPNVIFSLYNEPQCGGGFATDSLWGVSGQPTQAQGAQMYKSFMESTIDIIRSQDNGNHVISSSLAFLWYWDYNLKIDRPNVIVEGHSYSVVGTDFFNLGWRYNQPFMLSEFGGIEVGLSSRTTTITQLQTCNQNNVAWCYLRYDRVSPSTQTWTDLQNNLKPNLTYYH